LETSGVEVPAGVEPVGAEGVPLEPAEVEAEAEDSVVPALLEAVSLAVSLAEVEAGPELELELVVVALLLSEVRIGATEIGTPAAEHWETTMLETARYISM
jgi:hypothetical protein